VNYFEESTLFLVTHDPDLKYILVVANGINGLDASGVEMLKNLLDRLNQNQIALVFCSIKGNVIDVMQRTGLIDKIGKDNIFASEDAALKEIAQRLARAEPNAGETHAMSQAPA
jgi:SulP family sulfate permease